MASKPTFSKLKLQLDKETIPVQMGEQTVQIRKYLPIEEKLELISKVIMQAHEPESNYNNPVKTDALIALEIVFAYTDLVFTEKQKEDLPKLYDLIHCNGIDANVIEAIGREYNEIKAGVYRSIEAVYSYQNSALGILDAIRQEHDALEFNIEDLQKKLANTENLDVVKEVLNKLG